VGECGSRSAAGRRHPATEVRLDQTNSMQDICK
jgi:hypothetical protein